MPEFKRIRQRTTNSERIRTGVAQVEPNELVITTDSNELYFKNQQGEFIKVSVSKELEKVKTDVYSAFGAEVSGYIQDSGEKIMGNYYFDKLTTGLFRCIKSGNINYNSSEYFENESNYALSDNLTKLDEAIDFNLLATLGIEYGGILNNTNAKVAGKAYYDTTGKKLYKCIVNTSINYADAGFFEALSNNDLLGKLQNLFVVQKTFIFNSSGMWINFIKYNDFILADYTILNTLQPGVYQIQVPSEFLPTVKEIEMVESDVLGVYFRKTGLSIHVARENPNSSFLATKTVIYK